MKKTITPTIAIYTAFTCFITSPACMAAESGRAKGLVVVRSSKVAPEPGQERRSSIFDGLQAIKIAASEESTYDGIPSTYRPTHSKNGALTILSNQLNDSLRRRSRKPLHCQLVAVKGLLALKYYDFNNKELLYGFLKSGIVTDVVTVNLETVVDSIAAPEKTIREKAISMEEFRFTNTILQALKGEHKLKPSDAYWCRLNGQNYWLTMDEEENVCASKMGEDESGNEHLANLLLLAPDGANISLWRRPKAGCCRRKKADVEIKLPDFCTSFSTFTSAASQSIGTP